MARPRRKSPDDLMQESIWSLYDICRLFRKGPKTIMQYVNHPDPKKRLPGFMINGEFCAEKAAVLKFFTYRPFGNERVVKETEAVHGTELSKEAAHNASRAE